MAFREAERAASRYLLFRAIALRLAAEAALENPFGEAARWLREAKAVRAPAAVPDRQRLPWPAGPGRDDAALARDLLRLGVTAREAEVLGLAGERLSNKDIAGQLYLSPRTAEKHVASLLLKTGAAGRAALGWLARQR